MHNKRLLVLALFVIGFISLASTCRDRSGGVFTIALDGKFSTLDPIGSVTVDANAERIRTLMYNSLIKKDEKFEYVGDLATEIKASEDGLSYTFPLRDGVKFHNGKVLDSGDVKYTFEKLVESKGAKGAAFFETVDGKKIPIIESIETPDDKTVVLKIGRPELKNKLLPNLVPIAIIPKGSEVGEGSNAATNPPPGTGSYKFKLFDTSQNVVEVEAFEESWEGAPNIKNIRVKVLADANALQAELLSGRVQLAPAARNLSPDSLKSLDNDPNLKLVEIAGSNIRYLWFNTEAKPVDNPKIRQAVAHAINREKIIDGVLDGQAVLAHSLLPAESWAYSEGTRYDFDVEKAKKLLDEAGLKDGNGDGLVDMEPIVLKISSSSKATQQYAQVVQSQLKEIGLPVNIESLEGQTMRQQVSRGQFILTTGIWVGGNQDPIFLKDLFASSEIPTEKRVALNRGRYSNKEVDELLDNALKELDREKAKEYYVKAWEKISADAPFIPLWYPKNMIVASNNVENIQMNASGDWDFVRKLTLK